MEKENLFIQKIENARDRYENHRTEIEALARGGTPSGVPAQSVTSSSGVTPKVTRLINGGGSVYQRGLSEENLSKSHGRPSVASKSASKPNHDMAE